MADGDNVRISTSASTASWVAADQVSDGSYVQYIKLVDGTADSTAVVGGSTAYGLQIDVIRNPYSSALTFTHSVVAVTTSGYKAILSTSASRRYALIVNDSNTKLYISMATAAYDSSGIPLYAQGGSFEMSIAHGNIWQGVVTGVHSGRGSKTVLVTVGS